ncbi:hypothetical protein V6N13_040486 [Hibiscus sabdariffa]
MCDMATSMASLALDDVRLTVAKADIVFHWDLSVRAPDRRPLPENRWHRDETVDHVPGFQDSDKSCGIHLPNFSVNYGKNFRSYYVGDSSLSAKSTGEVLGRLSYPMDFQMGCASEDSMLAQPEGNKRIRTHDSVIVVSAQNDSIVGQDSSLSAGLQEQARRDQ